jgi:hypothetical protein
MCPFDFEFLIIVYQGHLTLEINRWPEPHHPDTKGVAGAASQVSSIGAQIAMRSDA